MERTIAAISTPQGNGGIAVIRISGNDAVKVADKVFFGSKKLADCDTHTVHYGFIKNEKGEKVDEVLATVRLGTGKLLRVKMLWKSALTEEVQRQERCLIRL